MISTNLDFGKILPFNFTINKINIDGNNITVNEQHIHDACEICFNLTGDISFMVEDSVYSVSNGDVIITRPFEAHHCIYHSKIPHKHYWILFSYKGNEEYLDLFFNREKGVGNLISLSASAINELTYIFEELIRAENTPAEKYTLFFKMLEILNQGKIAPKNPEGLQAEIIKTLQYINDNILQNLSVKDLASNVHMSISGFERLFKKEIGLSPVKYIQNKRLGIARGLLSDGYSVSSAAEKSGFSDVSYFISLFKKTYGTTPFKFKAKI